MLPVRKWRVGLLDRTRRQRVLVGTRPEDTSVRPPDEGQLKGRIAFYEPYGNAVYAFVELSNSPECLENRPYLVARTDVHDAKMEGELVSVLLRKERILLFDPEFGNSDELPCTLNRLR